VSSRIEPIRDLLRASALRDGRIRRVRSGVRLECIVSGRPFGNRRGLLRLQQHPTGFRSLLPQSSRQQSVKATEQQDIQALHRARELVIKQRTALCNQIRGLELCSKVVAEGVEEAAYS